MIFGANPTYLYGEIFKDKFSTPTKGYKIEPLPVACSECPAKLTDGKIEIFFAGPIFNTYRLSEEDRVTVLRSYDDKLTIIKGKLAKDVLYTVRIVREDDRVREVGLYEFDGLFPGHRTTGILEISESRPQIATAIAKGAIVLQNNEHRPQTEALLYKIEDGVCEFVEINNPVERCHVKVVKDLRGTKIVESGHVRGVVIDCKSAKAELDVYARRVCLGNYIFVEDLQEGTATVKLLGRAGSAYKVEHRGFVGICDSKRVSATMKGRIHDIKGATFKFQREDENGAGTAEDSGTKRAASDEHKSTKRLRDSAENKENSANKPKASRTADFEEIKVYKHVKIEDESQIRNDQLRAIEFIKTKMESTPNLLPLFNKYILSLDRKDELCLFYLQYLRERGLLTTTELARVLKITSGGFSKRAAEAVDDPELLFFIFKRKKTPLCFTKLLGLVEDKAAFVKENREYADCAIDYIYKNMENPRVLVESIVGTALKNWIIYLRHEEGNYKRGLFRRLVKMGLKKEEAKRVFEMWLAFEESVHGNVEEVKEQAKAYVDGKL